MFGVARDWVLLDASFAGGSSIELCAFHYQAVLQAAEEGVWSDMDTLLLLEGLELFGDNWADISDHVGNKSQAGPFPIQRCLQACKTGNSKEM